MRKEGYKQEDYDMQYSQMSTEELQELKKKISEQYKESKSKGLNLNMARGKPATAQLDVSMGMLDVINSSSDLIAEDGTDCRNYGLLDGLLKN